MTNQNYLIVVNNVVTNVVVWDGDVSQWQPPADAIMLVQDTTPTMVWKLNALLPPSYELTEKIGGGQIDFTWNGTVLTTNEERPTDPIQPTTSGTVTA